MKTNIDSKEHAIKTIQYEEWLRYTVKNLVEDKPEISDCCLLELVDDKYNDVFFYDNSMYKVKQEGDELVKCFTRMNPKGTSRQDIKEFSNTVLSLKDQYTTFSKKYNDVVTKWNPDKKKFAKNVAKIFFNVSNNEETLEAVRKFFANLQYNMGNKHFKAQQSLLYLLSKDFGGTGKTYFMERLTEWAAARNISTVEASVDTTYIGTEFSKTLIGTIGDYTPTRQVFETLNRLVDNVTYTCRQKYKDDCNLTSRITFVMGSNYMVQDGNSRRWSVVDYNIYPYSEWTNTERAQAAEVDYMKVFDILLNTVPVESFKVTKHADKNDRSSHWEEIMFEMRDELDDRKKYSSKGLWMLAEPHMTSEQTKYLTLKSLRMFLTELAAKKKIVRYMDPRGNSQFSKLVTYIDSIDSDEFEEVNYAVTGTPIKNCMGRWNEIISKLDNNNPVPPTGNDDPDEIVFNSVSVNETVFDEEIEYTQPSECKTPVKETKFIHEAKAAGFYVNDKGYVDLTKTDVSLVFNDKLTDEQLIKNRAIFNTAYEKSISNAARQTEKVKDYLVEKLSQKSLEVTKFMVEHGLENTSPENLNIFDL